MQQSVVWPLVTLTSFDVRPNVTCSYFRPSLRFRRKLIKESALYFIPDWFNAVRGNSIGGCTDTRGYTFLNSRTTYSRYFSDKSSNGWIEITNSFVGVLITLSGSSTLLAGSL
jgi:hypothetical protein